MNFSQKKCSPHECKPICRPANCPPTCDFKSDLCVEKNLLSVSKVSGNANFYFSLELIYEIVLFNRGGCQVVDLQIYDTFAGLSSSPVLNVVISASTFDDNLILDTNSNIRSSGNFLKSGSYLNTCSVSRILVKMTLFANRTTVDQLLNTITVSGNIQSTIDCCIKKQRIEPITVKSELWSDENGVLLISIE